jgi:hypothetical protein
MVLKFWSFESLCDTKSITSVKSPAMNAKILGKFKEMSLTRKFVVGFFALSALAMLVDGGFFGALIVGAVAYYLTVTSGEQVIENNLPQHVESDDELRLRQEEYAAACDMEKEERLAEMDRRDNTNEHSSRGW